MIRTAVDLAATLAYAAEAADPGAVVASMARAVPAVVPPRATFTVETVERRRFTVVVQEEAT